jgi:hypothetical protein
MIRLAVAAADYEAIAATCRSATSVSAWPQFLL